MLSTDESHLSPTFADGQSILGAFTSGCSRTPRLTGAAGLVHPEPRLTSRQLVLAGFLDSAKQSVNPIKKKSFSRSGDFNSLC